MTEVWILGGTGRVGRGVAALLSAGGVEPVLVGRDPARLREAAAATGSRTYDAPTLDAQAAGATLHIRTALRHIVQEIGDELAAHPVISA